MKIKAIILAVILILAFAALIARRTAIQRQWLDEQIRQYELERQRIINMQYMT